MSVSVISVLGEVDESKALILIPAALSPSGAPVSVELVVEAGPLRVPRHQMVPSIQGIPARAHRVSQWARVGAQDRARSLEMGVLGSWY
nr:hypothetical protein [Tanacetum cinerariifolium]